MTERITANEYRQKYGLEPPKQQNFTPEPKSSKYRNKRTEYNGVVYDSMLEADYAMSLDTLKQAGVITGWTRQIKFHLSRTRSHRVDFLLLYPDLTFEFVECKGQELPEGKLRRELVEEQNGIKIRVVRK